MAYSNVEKQQRYRQRLREQGLVQVQGWVTPEQAAAIRRIMAERCEKAPSQARCDLRKATGAYPYQNPT